MSEALSFPGLGLTFDINRVAFTAFGIPVYWYGVIIAAAFLIGAVYTLRRVKTFGLDGDRFMDVILGGVVLGIVCARLYYVIFSWDTYADDPITIFYLRKGGLAIYGGVIGVVIAALVVCKWRKVKLLPTLDLGVGGLLIGQAIGRWGNFVNIEAFGSNTTLPWGMYSSSISYYLQTQQAHLAAIGVAVDPTMPVHPTFLYESLWCLLGFLLVAFYTKRRRFDGELSLMYLGWYGLGRFFIEGLRTDPLLIGTIRVSQIVALLCVILSAVLLIVVHSRIRRANDPDYMPLYVNTPEGQAVLAGEFYKKKEAARKDEETPGAPQEDAGTEDTDTKDADTEGTGTEDTDTEDADTKDADTEDADAEDADAASSEDKPE